MDENISHLKKLNRIDSFFGSGYPYVNIKRHVYHGQQGVHYKLDQIRFFLSSFAQNSKNF